MNNVHISIPTPKVTEGVIITLCGATGWDWVIPFYIPRSFINRYIYDLEPTCDICILLRFSMLAESINHV